MLRMAVDSDHVPNGIGPDHTGQLCCELELAGVELLLTRDRDGGLATGVAVSANAHATQASAGAANRFRQQAYDTLVNGLPLSVSVNELGDGNHAYAALCSVCDLLRLAMHDAGASPSCIEVVVAAKALSPRDAWLARSERLGDGPVHILLGRAAMQTDRSDPERAHHGRIWSQLWHAHACGQVRAAYAPVVVPQCYLLTAEVANCILPATGIQVPDGSAWLPMRLDVARFANRSGSLNESGIEHALRRCVEIGDALHDLIFWSTAQTRHDAWSNRRLAIVLTGFGDLISRRALDPKRFASLKELSELLRWIQDVLQGQSRVIARRNGHLPSLEQSDPSHAFPSGHVRNGWRTRWLDAVESTAVRHRNLVVLSPWSVFPARQAADYRYADLLPLLGRANACSFSSPPPLSHWNSGKFKSFHQRAWAVLQQRSTAFQIAEGL